MWTQSNAADRRPEPRLNRWVTKKPTQPRKYHGWKFPGEHPLSSTAGHTAEHGRTGAGCWARWAMQWSRWKTMGSEIETLQATLVANDVACAYRSEAVECRPPRTDRNGQGGAKPVADCHTRQ